MRLPLRLLADFRFIKDNAYNPESVSISDMGVVYLDDSVCVLNFRCVSENRIDGSVNNKCQFIWLRHKGDLYQCFQTNSDEQPEGFDSDDWLGENTSMLGWSLPLDMMEIDKFVRDKVCPKNDTKVHLDDKYIRAYCIVMKKGEKVVVKRNDYMPTEFSL